jgi:dTDP-4-dehydrorhamnose 3,5-epimerase-like enzyme
MKESPKIIKGNSYLDERGAIIFNNTFDATVVKRIYFIENKKVEFVRAWQGHQIESRWFSAVSGSFKIKVITIDDWENPNPRLEQKEYILKADKLDVLQVPNGNCTSIQALESNARLVAMSDYLIGEVKDEYRFPSEYFTK